MGHRGMLWVLAILLSAVLLAGCGDGSKSNEGKQTTKDPRRAYEGTTLHVLLKEGYEINVIQKYVQEFEKATGIKVQLEVYDEPTTRQKYILDATSKTGAYDVTAVSFWYFPEYQRNGWVEPLDDYMANKADKDWFHKEDIPQSALDVFAAEGKHYAMPHTIISGMTTYRKDIFEKHHLNPPQTTDDIIALAPKLKQLEPNMIPITGRGAPNFASMGTYLGWAWGYGAQLLDDKIEPHANSPEMVKAITDYVNLLKNYGPADAPSLNFVAAGEKMQSGQAVMMFDTTGWGTILEDPTQSKVNGKIGYTIVKGPAGRPLQWIYMEGLAINSASKNKDAAWLFLQWRMSRETTMKELTQLGRTDVPNLFVLNSPEYKKFAEEKKITAYTQLLPEAWKMADIKYWPFVPEFAEIGDAFMAEVSAAIAGKQDVPTALNKAQAKIEDILKKAGYK
ncbi:MAG: sugar ABC transporter substrate-binding protein [Limnochordaceae bacterium]|nr:sugar ABC transporter substrate-binding protein [Limnochordaceae bacterium]